MSDESKATGKDAIFFQVILTSMRNKPDVDWAVVAEKSGYKDAKTANTRFGQIMKKLTGLTPGQAMAASGAGAGNAATPKKPKATPVKKENGSGTNTTPSKVTKRAPKKSKVKIEIHEDEDEEELEPEPVEPKKDIIMVDDEEHEADDFVDAEEEIDA